MTRRSPLGRVGYALLTAVQLTLPAAVVVADACPPPAVAAGSRATSPTAIPAQHGHPDDCAFCQFLTHAVGPLGTAARLGALAECPQARATEFVRMRPFGRVAASRARAPPPLS